MNRAIVGRLDAAPLSPDRFPPGEGPFRARGVLVGGIVTYCKHRTPGGLDAVLAGMDAVMRPYFEGAIFLASSLYDLSPLVAFVNAAAVLHGQTPADFVRARAQVSAKQAVEHLYQRQLAASDAKEMATRLPRIFERFFDPCHAEGVAAEQGRMAVRFTGLPRAMAGFYAWSCEGFVPEALRLAGASNVRHEWDPPVDSGEASGVPLVDLQFRLEWD